MNMFNHVPIHTLSHVNQKIQWVLQNDIRVCHGSRRPPPPPIEGFVRSLRSPHCSLSIALVQNVYHVTLHTLLIINQIQYSVHTAPASASVRFCIAFHEECLTYIMWSLYHTNLVHFIFRELCVL